MLFSECINFFYTVQIYELPDSVVVAIEII